MRRSVGRPAGAGKPGPWQNFCCCAALGVRRVCPVIAAVEHACRAPAGFTIRAAALRQALPTNNIDMSSTESSGAAPAEATATTPAGATAAATTFGSSRGSGLARGKRPTTSGPATSTAATATGYTPTAIEIVTAPREYQNPFAPASTEPVVSAETPAAATPEPTAPAAPAPVAPVQHVAPVATPAPRELFPLDEPSAPASPAAEEPAELNILPPERQKTTPAQTWESEGFRPARESRGERPRREEPVESSEPAGEVDIASIPPQFLYVRPGVKFVPTPRNWGGAPRERGPKTESAPAAARTASAAPAPAKSAGGFLGWLKGLFGGTAEAQPSEARTGEHRSDRGERGGQRRQRSGHSHGEGRGHGGEHREGGRRRRGGRGRGPRSESGGSSAT